MRSFISKITLFLKSEDGPTAVEYGVILALIFLVCISAIVLLGQSTKACLQHSNEQIGTSMGLPS